MDNIETCIERLRQIPGIELYEYARLSDYTRFGIGGPARAIVDASTISALQQALQLIQAHAAPYFVLGGGTNVVVPDEGFPGLVLRFTGAHVDVSGTKVEAEAGVLLQQLVDLTIEKGLAGLETLTGIPGTLGAAIYGNAGAYGRSIADVVSRVRYLDHGVIRERSRQDCEFHYRESIFKRRQDWIIVWAQLELEPGDPEQLRQKAAAIRAVRDRKYPPEMKCAGSVFKNLLLEQLPEELRRQVPPEIIREGKVPAAYFLEQAGAKGEQVGGMRVADYHANLIYNTGTGTARDLLALVEKLKEKVRARFGLELEEEIQYLGFSAPARPAGGAPPA